MIKTIIFDLSEVLIAGMYGAEKILAKKAKIAPDIIMQKMSNKRLQKLFRGEITEDEYLTKLLKQNEWHVSPAELKRILRRNFHRCVPGMDKVVSALAQRYELVLLSDHTQEWVDYIKPIHQVLLDHFCHVLFSCDPRLQLTKKDPAIWPKVLEIIGARRNQCLFIDDSQSKIDRAEEMGIRGICFTDAKTFVQDQLPQFGIRLRLTDLS